MFLFIDTETTGFPKKHGPRVQDGQARVCQVAMLLTNRDGRSMAEFSTIIKPEGWTVGEEAGSVHGFTDDICRKFGVNGGVAYSMFQLYAGLATMIVAHNSAFDREMMEIEGEYCRYRFPALPWFCTMEATVNICNLPPTPKMLAAGFNKPKNPKLEEAYQHICGKALGAQAHDAMWDVRACRDIFFAIGKGREHDDIFPGDRP